jgi:hypothetical protein
MERAVQPALDAARSETLRAAVERILPGTHGPGAVRTAAAAGFERALLDPYYRGLRRGVEALLDQLQAQARERHGLDFTACDAEQRDELLRGVEHDPNPAMRWVFRILIGLSLEGLLGDPQHGGNRDASGWEFIGVRADDIRSGFCRRLQGNA